MLQIRSVEELIQVIREHPEWREALLSALLPQDLLALPQEFRSFREEMREILLEHQKRMQAHEERMAGIEEQIALQRAEFDKRMQEMRASFEQHMQEMRTDFEQRLQEMREDFTRQMQEMRADLERQIQQTRAELERQIQETRAELERQIQETRAELERQIQETRAELERQIQETRAELERQIQELRVEMLAGFKRVDERFEQVDKRFEQVDQELKEIRDDLGKVKGIVLEMQWGHRAKSYFGRLLRKVKVYAPGEICDEIDERCTMSDAQRDQLLNLDYVVRGVRRSDGREVYLAVEVSWGIGVTDVIRARDRSQILRECGYPVYPVAVGEFVLPEAEDFARKEKVILMTDSQIQGADLIQYA